MKTSIYFNSLNEEVKKIAMIYFMHILKRELNAVSANDIFRKLKAIQIANPGLPDLPKLMTKFWHKKLRGESIDRVTMEKLEDYLPGITKHLRHPLWKILSTYSLNQVEVSELIDDLDGKIRTYLTTNNGCDNNLVNICNYRVLCYVLRKINLDTFAALLLVLISKIKRKDYFLMEATFTGTMRMFYSLTAVYPFNIVAQEIYQIYHERFYLEEADLLKRYDDPEFLKIETNKNTDFHSTIYSFSYYPDLNSNEFRKYTEYLKFCADEAVRLGVIGNHDRAKFTYYRQYVLPKDCTNDTLRRTSTIMNIDKRKYYTF